MSKNKKFARTRNWASEHRFEIAYASMIAAACAAYAGLTYLAIKQEADQVEAARKLRDWIVQENSKGRTVVKLADGDYLSYVPEIPAA